MVKKGLGKGLAALIGENAANVNLNSDDIISIPISKVRANPLQPRKTFNQQALNELAESLRQYGIVQPLIVVKAQELREGDPAFYEIVAGERRWRAAQIANLEEVPCLIKNLNPEEIIEIALIENIQREDLNILEEASTYQRLIADYAYTQGDLARRLGKSRPHITNTLRLLNLDPALQSLIKENHLSPGHGRALLSLEDEDLRLLLAKKIVAERLSVRQTEELIRSLNEDKNTGLSPKAATKENPKQDPIFCEVENRLRTRLATQVKMERKGKGGRIIVEYYSDSDLQRVLDSLFPGEDF